MAEAKKKLLITAQAKQVSEWFDMKNHACPGK